MTSTQKDKQNLIKGGGKVPSISKSSYVAVSLRELTRDKISKSNQLSKNDMRLRNVKDMFNKMGWDKAYIDAEITTDDMQLLKYGSDTYFIEKRIESWYPENALNMSWNQIFKACGLKRNTIKIVIDVITPLFDTCYATHHLYDIATEYLVNSLMIHRNNNPFYIGLENPVNTWIEDVQYKWYCNISHTNPKRPINSQMASILHKLLPKDQKYQLFFHATTWRYATDIIQNITHDKGRLCLDFGMSRSFYLTPNIHMAIEWCTKNKKSWFDETCILIYNINLATIKTQRHKVFTNADDEWTRLVTESRRCVKNILDKCDYAYGPMAANPNEIQQNEVARPHHELRFQLASKTESNDDLFTQCYAGVLFMKK